MSALSLVVLSLLTAMPPASCQRGWRGKRHWASQRNLQRQTQASGWDVFPTTQGNLQPWMQGLIAVAVFLVLVAIAFAVNHFWCQEEPASINTVMTIGNTADGILVGTDGKYSSMAASFRSSEHENAYENIPEEEGKVHSTPM
ncbi:PREDICTED: PDZK1-interacting protein 1 isoform X3 [Capra hircus]|uniref:PDZK1-interacting protein 1 n=2 Tax=Capra hircus TaxID=9925 RepID=A0A8C2NJE5_CAPHI|nr:PREDICTED: PDZK1-interacting protein 1 isoform X3 [Capra hircus]